jgi:methyl-accepting chemotaxis protein
MGDATRYLESFADQLQDAAARHERAADAAENAAHSNARVADVLESMPVHLGSMNESLTEAADSLKETASLTVQGYAKGAEQQQRFLQGLSEGLRRFAESIQNVLQGYGNEMQAQTRARIQEFAEETADILNKLETFQNQLDQNVEFVEVAVNRLRNGSGHNGSRH